MTRNLPAPCAEPGALALTAIRAGRLRLALQPVRPAARPDRLAFAEALARVAGPDGGWLSAAAFVPALEARGHAPALDRAALAGALALLGGARRARISVNVSARSIGDAAWMDALERAARRDPDAARRLIVELTETAAADPADAMAFRRRVGAAGPAFALDDFGAGNASEAQAARLRPDVLKFDASFADALRRGGAAASLAATRLRRAISAAARTETMTVAEGVRSAAEAAMFARMGVHAVQGFGLGAPALAPSLAAAA